MTEQLEPRSNSLSDIVAPACLFVLLAALTVFGWRAAEGTSTEQLQQRFETAAGSLTAQVEARINVYEQVLLGGLGIFEINEQVSREQWRTYIESLQLSKHFPGFQGIGYSQWLGDERGLRAHELEMRGAGFVDYSVYPNEPREHYTAIVFLEPFDARNQRAFGYDMYAEATRREAMERARATGQAALSGKVELVQEITDDKQGGFLLYVPVYQRESGTASGRNEERVLRGFVYSPFRTDDLMHGIMDTRSANLEIQIFDGAEPSQGNLLYDGISAGGVSFDEAEFAQTTRRTIAGRTWTFRVTGTKALTHAEHGLLQTTILLEVAFC